MTSKSFSPFVPVLLWISAFICGLYPVNDWQLWLFPMSISLLFGWSFLKLSDALREGWKIPQSSVLFFSAAFWLLVVASVFWSEAKTISLIIAALFTALPMTFLTNALAPDEKEMTRIAKALGVIAAVLCVWAMFQYYFLNSFVMGQARHPLADPSSLGSLLLMALFCALGWMISDRPAGEQKLAFILVNLCVFGIISTAARGPVFAFLPGMAVMGWCLWPRLKAHKKELAAIVILAIGFYALSLTGVQKNYDLGSRLFGDRMIYTEDVTNNRIKVWTSSIEMIKDRPLLGTGFGTFFIYYPEYRLPTELDGVKLAHNDPLQYFVELGVLGPLLFYAFAAACIFRSVRALKKLEGNDRIIVASIFAALTALVATSHVGFSLYNISILYLTGFLLAVWFHITGKVANEKIKLAVMPASLPTGGNKGLLALPYVMTCWLVFSVVAGDHYANKASEALFKDQIFEFADYINKAGRVSHDLNARAYLLAVNVPMSILESKKTISDEEQTKLYEQVQSYMNKVLAINPRTAGAYFYLGKVQTMIRSGLIPPGTPLPEEYYKKTLVLDPTHLGARLALYRLYKAMGKSSDEQLGVLEPGLRLLYVNPMAEEFYAEAAKAYLENKDYGKAREVMAMSVAFHKRSEFSKVRQQTSLPQAIVGGDEMFPKFR